MELRLYKTAVLDTSSCIYFLEGSASDRRRTLLEPLVAAAEEGDTDLIVSALTVTELLTGPLRSDDLVAEAKVRVFLYGLCRPVPVDVDTAEAAAAIRSTYGLRTPDAIVCATGVTTGAEAVIGNDARWKRIAEVGYVHLDDFSGSR